MDLKYTADNFFKEFARRHSLRLEYADSGLFELQVRIPAQETLSFNVQLGYYGDVLQVTVGEHIGEWYICDAAIDKAWQTVLPILDGLINGECRIIEFRQFGRVWKTAIERFSTDRWSSISTRYHTFLGLHWPLIGSQSIYIHNKRTPPTA